MATAIQQELPAATWAVDNVHSTVGFAIKYMVSTFRTEFERYEATLDTTGDEPRLYGSVAPESIVIKEPNFHAHLQSPDFFDTERHPAITLESTAFRIDGDERVGIQLEASIDRSHFGVSWIAPLPKGGLALANETKLFVDLFFVRQ